MHEFDEKEVVAELALGEESGIESEAFVDQPKLTVVGVASPVAVVPQRQRSGEPGHGIVGMLVLDEIDEIPRDRPDHGDSCWNGRGLR